MSLNMNVGLLGFKVEAVAGTAETITGTEVKLLVTDPEVTIEPVSFEHTPVKQALGTVKRRPGGRRGTITFRVGLKGSGTPGTAPAQGDLFKACLMAETVEAGIRTMYKPATVTINAQTTLTMKLFQDGRATTLKGCMGTVKFTGKGNEIHFAEYEFQGVFHEEVDVAVPTPSLETTEPDVLIQSYMHLLEYHSPGTQEGTGTGTALDLRQAAAVNVLLAAQVDNTGATILEVGRVRLYLSKPGAPAAYTNGIWVTIEGDAAGAPDGVPVATSLYVDPAYISATGFEWIDFVFPTPPPLGAATTYWAVLQGDFTAGANIVEWETETTAAGSTSMHFDAAWLAVPGNDNFMIQTLVAKKACIFFDGAEFDIANTVNLRQDVACAAEGWDRAMITKREPLANLEPEQELIADRDFLDYHQNETRLMLAYQIGTADGERVEVHAPYSQIVNVEGGDRDEVITAPLEIAVNSGIPNTVGNDEFEIRFT